MPGKSTEQTVAHSIQLTKVQTAYRILAPEITLPQMAGTISGILLKVYIHFLYYCSLAAIARAEPRTKGKSLLDSLALELCGTTSLSMAWNLDLTEVRVIFVFGFEKRGLDNFLMLYTIYRY